MLGRCRSDAPPVKPPSGPVPRASGRAGRVLRSLLAASLPWWPAARPAAADVQAAAYLDGRRTTLPADRVLASGLVALCEAQLTSADGVLRLGVSSQSIEALRREVPVLEITYPAAKQFRLALGGREISASRLLIPLAGDLAGSITTLFYANPDYQSGPLRNSKGTADIAGLVKSMTPAGR